VELGVGRFTGFGEGVDEAFEGELLSEAILENPRRLVAEGVWANAASEVTRRRVQ
jgi:hypothetical protein